jgi:hypothetical protein
MSFLSFWLEWISGLNHFVAHVHNPQRSQATTRQQNGILYLLLLVKALALRSKNTRRRTDGGNERSRSKAL